MSPGDVYLGSFPFGGKTAKKIRPVLLLTDLVGPVPEVLVAYVSSVIPPVLLPSDLVMDPSDLLFATTNLKTLSILRLHKLATIHQRDLVRKLGSLSSAAFLEAQSRLKTFLQLS